MAVETTIEIGRRVKRFVSAEDLIFPLAVAFRLGVFAAPTRPLCHDPIAADGGCLDEAAVGVLDGITLRVKLRREVDRL